MREVAVAVLASMIGVCLAGSSSGGVVKIKKPEYDPDFKALTGAKLNRWINAPVKDVPSRRKILKSTQRRFPHTLAGVVRDTLRICAIRVEFENVPDYSKITGGTGRFDLTDRRGEVPIDPPPHDGKYFSKHMEALDYYYNTMSYGSLIVEWDVYPLENDGAYVLDDVGDYNPGGGQWTWTVEGLELFFRDAIRSADQDPDLTYGDYDAVVVIHAGSDWQNDILGDSPYDIPSFFISLADTAAIAVDDSTHFVVDGSVVPETTSQDGFFGGINGVLAHEIGHQLGLPDLYDTFTGLSVVGYWCLMDFGSGVGVVLQDTVANEAYFVSGIIPASICAWSKSYLGWAVPDTVLNQGRFWLDATELQDEFPSREMLMVPINSYEYYLVENRQDDLDGDGAGYLLTDPSEDSTGVIIGPVNADRERNYEFDFALPGSGLLIWHVDQIIVDFGNPYDIVNAFRPRRGVRLVEADGIPDLGDINSFYFLGGPDDPFREGNNDRFADDTYPMTTSNTGCHSHIVFRNITPSDITMSVRVAHQWGQRDFPVSLGDSMRFGVPSILFTDVDKDGSDEVQAALKRAAWADSVVWLRSEVYSYEADGAGGLRPVAGWPRRLHGSHPTELVGINLDASNDGSLETVVADETGHVYAFSCDGSPVFAGSDSLGAFYTVKGGINGVPVAGTFSRGDFRPTPLVFVGTDSALYFLGYFDGFNSFPAGPEDLGYSQPILADVFGGGPSPDDPEIIYYREGRIEIISLDIEERLAVVPIPTTLDAGEVYLAGADLDRDPGGGLEIILVGKDGWVCVVKTNGEFLPGWNRKLTSGVVAPPALADINGDGYLEMILNDGKSRSIALLHTGSILQGWPNSWYGCSLPVWDEDFFPPDRTISLPSAIIGDFDSDDVLDVLQGSLFECVTGWEPAGGKLEGFPVTMGGGCSALALGDIDGDGVFGIVAGGGDGYLYGFTHLDADSTAAEMLPWRTAYFDHKRNPVYPYELMPQQPVPGNNLLVSGSFHAYPNPAGGEDPATGEKTVKFVFETETGGVARIDVFDITGLKVKSVLYDATSQVSRITVPPVDIGDLGSGLYMCKLNLENNGKNSTEFFKLAIRR